LTPKYGAEFVKLIQVTLLQSGDSLLTQFEDSMQQLAIDTFRDRVEIVFNARVVEVTDSASASAGGVRARAGRGAPLTGRFCPIFSAPRRGRPQGRTPRRLRHAGVGGGQRHAPDRQQADRARGRRHGG
jgi:hypothetical protein